MKYCTIKKMYLDKDESDKAIYAIVEEKDDSYIISPVLWEYDIVPQEEVMRYMVNIIVNQTQIS